MADRAKWASAFYMAGIERAEMMAMSESQFQEACKFLLESNLASEDMLEDDNLQKALAASLESEQTKVEDSSAPKEPEHPKEPEQKASWTFGKWNTSAWTKLATQKTTASGMKTYGQAKPAVGFGRPSWERSEKPKEEPKPHFEHASFMRHSPAPEPVPKPQTRLPPRRQTISGEIRNEQDAEYMQCQRDAIEQERKAKQEEQRQLREQEEREAREREEKEQQALKGEQLKEAVKKAVQDLGPEPAQGVQLAIQMPSKKRLMRKFAKESLCDQLFIFVAAEDEMFDEELNQVEFSLSQGTGCLQKGKTFEEQGITRRTLINVIIE